MRGAHVDDEGGKAVGAPLRLIARRGAGEQQHQVGMLGATGPHLLAVHHVVVALALGERAQAGGVGATGRLGDAERLQAQFAGGDLGEVVLLLLLRAMPQDGAHDVHLRVACSAVAALGVDGLKDRSGGGERQAGAAVFLGDQRGEIAGLGEGVDELGGIGAVAVQVAPVLAGEAGTEFCHLNADLGVRVGGKLLVHGGLPRLARVA